MKRNGFALIGALWLLVAISVIGLELGLQARERRLAATNHLEAAKTRAAALAGLEHARSRLEAPLRGFAPLGTGLSVERLLDPWFRPDSLVPEGGVLADAKYRISARDVGARLNLNRATESELRRLLEALAVDAGVADRIAQSVADWRDPDDFYRARGAEADDYALRSSPMLPRNGPFPTLSELLFVKHVTPEIYELMRPHLTLHGTGRVNLNSASAPVLRALPGMSEPAVGVILRLRRQGPLPHLFDLTALLPTGARAIFQAEIATLLGRTTTTTREVEVRTEGFIEGGRLRTRVDALLVRAGESAQIIWRRVQ